MKIKELFLTEAGNQAVLHDLDIHSLTEYKFPDKISSIRIVNCNNLTDLIGFPTKVTGSQISIMNCNKLSSLTGLPKTATAQDVYLHNLPAIKNLKGMPKSVRSLSITECKILESLEGIPEKIKVQFTTKDIPRLKSLHNIHEMLLFCPGVFLMPKHVTSSILGFLLIPSIKGISVLSDSSKNLIKAVDIINKYLNGTRNVWQCQDELQDNDLDDYADL